MWSAVVGVVLSSVYFLVSAWPHLQAIVSGGNDAVCGCETAFAWTDHLWLNFTMLTLGVLSSALLLKIILTPMVQLWQTHRFVRSLAIQDRVQWNTVPVHVVHSEQLYLFTTGIVRPRIVISTHAFEQLSPQEREAAFEHERGHVLKRHVFMRVLTAGLPKTLRTWIHRLQEYRADAFALSSVESESLLSAITSVCDQSHAPAAASFGATEERLQLLLGHRIKRPSLALLPALLLTTGFGLFAHSVQWVDASSSGLAPAACLQQTPSAQDALMSVDTAACVFVVQSEQGMSTQIELLTPAE